MADTYPKNTIDDNGLKKVWDMVMDRLGLKVDKEVGKGLSTNDYTTTEKDKLAGIANGAQVNTVTSVAGKTGAVELTKSDVGLGNVGNFKAVSTSANQGLTDTEKSNARVNIDTPSNGDIESSKTLKSSVVTVPDAAPINAEDITVDITPIQDLHGYDRPWAGGAGKNKLPMTVAGIKAANTVGTWSGNTYTVNGITITVLTDSGDNVTEIQTDGISTSLALFLLYDSTNLGGESVTLTGCPENGSGGTYQIQMYNVTDQTYEGLGGDYGNGMTFTPDANKRYRSDIVVRKNQNMSGKSFYPMLRLATETDSTFAPYSNNCPIRGRTGAELDRVGKNWLDLISSTGTKTNSGITSVSNGDGTFKISGKSNTTTHINIWLLGDYNLTYPLFTLKAGTYTISDVMLFRKTSTISDNTYIGGSSTFTLSEDTEITGVRVGEAVVNQDYDLTIHPQLELGSTATAYEPYQGQQYTASFGETVHGGKWHVTEGGTDKTYANIANYNGETINEPWLSSMDEYSPGATPTTGAQVVYPLTTPTTISTPKQNVPMLKGINTVSADCGETSLKYQPDNVVGELKGDIEDNIIYEDFKWTTQSSQSYSAGTPGTYGTSSWRDVKKEGYDVIGVTFVENRRFGDCILTLYYIPSTSHVEVIIFRATSSAVTIADEDIEYRVAYKKRT